MPFSLLPCFSGPSVISHHVFCWRYLEWKDAMQTVQQYITDITKTHTSVAGINYVHAAAATITVTWPKPSIKHWRESAFQLRGCNEGKAGYGIIEQEKEGRTHLYQPVWGPWVSPASRVSQRAIPAVAEAYLHSMLSMTHWQEPLQRSTERVPKWNCCKYGCSIATGWDSVDWKHLGRGPLGTLLTWSNRAALGIHRSLGFHL